MARIVAIISADSISARPLSARLALPRVVIFSQLPLASKARFKVPLDS